MTTGQPWLGYTFASLMIVTAAYCLIRLLVSWLRHRPGYRLLDTMHVLMAGAMAAMLVPQFRLHWIGLQALFAAAAAWFGWLAARNLRRAHAARGAWRHHVEHAVACLAMVYMLAAASGVAATAAGGTLMTGGAAHVRTLAVVLALVLLGCVVRTADRLSALPFVAALAAAAPPSAAAAPVIAAASLSGAAAAQPDCDDRAAPPAWVHGVPMSPRLAACCEIAIGVTMAYMLITMA